MGLTVGSTAVGPCSMMEAPTRRFSCRRLATELGGRGLLVEYDSSFMYFKTFESN